MDQADDRAKLLAAARALLARGDDKFSIMTVCAEARIERAAFHDHFAGKAALLAALTPAGAGEAKTSPDSPVPDAWLERRLRVFERSLNALEAKAEASAQAQARAMAQLEEKLLTLAGAPPAGPATPAEVKPEPAATQPAIAASEAPRKRVLKEPVPSSLAREPVPAVSRAEMADVLQAARSKARPVEEPPASRSGARMRWLAIGALSLVALFLFVGLMLGDSARATSAEREGSGVSRRQVAAKGLPRTIAMADAGNPSAQAVLAMAYLRGAGVASDTTAAARWSAAAAQGGEPMAQYLLGTLYGKGDGVKADPARAFALFTAAAARGNLKAMHNLAIAYIEGVGTPVDQARAAEWFARAAARGYVDSAFDLGVLYERGMGVPQDLAQALKWYEIAAKAGDAHSRERAEVLRGQLAPSQVQIAANEAMRFTALAPLASANRLPAF